VNVFTVANFCPNPVEQVFINLLHYSSCKSSFKRFSDAWNTQRQYPSRSNIKNDPDRGIRSSVLIYFRAYSPKKFLSSEKYTAKR
jgi:hypothetical protein